MMDKIQLESISEKYPILFYDGVCNLCNDSVQFIIKNDHKDLFRFAPLQFLGTDFIREIIPDKNIPDSVILLYQHQYYSFSDAVLKSLGLLGGIYKTGLLFYVIPKSLRDWVYRKIAANRYRWFGKKDICEIPDGPWQHRFLNFENN